MKQHEEHPTKAYPTREERLRKAAQRAVASKRSAHDFLLSAGIVCQDGTLAAHLR